jgi:hypothetical protein
MARFLWIPLGLSSSTWTIVGLALNAIGVVLLFLFGMPFEIPRSGPALLVRLANVEEKRKQALFRALGFVGLAAIILSLVFQSIGVLAATATFAGKLLAIHVAATPAAAQNTLIGEPFTTDPFLDGITLLLFLATLALATFTALLHRATVEVAKDTVAATKVGDRHHQESLSPVCVLREVFFDTNDYTVRARLKVQNVGAGPAIRINANIQCLGTERRHIGIGEVHTCDSLKSGDTTPDFIRSMEQPARGQDAVMFEIRLEYQNVFGAWGISTYNIYNGGYGLLTMELPKPQQRV